MAQKEKKKRNNKILWILLALVIGLVAAVYLVKGNRPTGEKVTTQEIEKRTITETVSASGRVYPETEVKISSDVSGEIVELYVEEGDSVVQGQILLRVDPDSYESAVERGSASVSGAQANLANSRSSIKNSEAGVTQAEAQIRQVQAQYNNAKTIHDRNVKLLEQGVISQVEFDASLSALQTNEANIASARASLESAKASLQSSKESSNASQFQVQSAKASLKELKTSLRRTTIYAPMSGVISSLAVEKGERVVGTIQMTGTEIMRIANLDLMEVQVDVSENDVLRVALNDPVDIEIDAYLDEKFAGTVSQIANSASGSGAAGLSTDQVTNFVVKILIDKKSYIDLIKPGKPFPFRPGMSASVDIKTNIEEDIIAIPIQSVASRVPKKKKEKDVEGAKAGEGDEEEATAKKVKSSDEDGEEKEVVFVVDGGSAKMVIIKTGIQDDEYIQVLEGLDTDMEIISGPYAAVSRKLEDGKEIQIVDEDKLYSSENRSIIIFTKNPELGKAKTRIAATLGDHAALDIYKQLLQITRTVVTDVPHAHRLLFYSDTVIQEDDWSTIDFQKYLQSNGDLGDRMEQAFSQAFKLSSKVLIIGSDCPYITPALIEDAFDSLDHHDVVIGPTFDGGYYMLGMNQLHPSLFRNMTWSTESVFDHTIARVDQLGLTYHTAPKLSDIDYAEDWEQYLRSIA